MGIFRYIFKFLQIFFKFALKPFLTSKNFFILQYFKILSMRHKYYVVYKKILSALQIIQESKNAKERLWNEMKMKRILALLLVAFMIAIITNFFNSNIIAKKFK